MAPPFCYKGGAIVCRSTAIIKVFFWSEARPRSSERSELVVASLRSAEDRKNRDLLERQEIFLASLGEQPMFLLKDEFLSETISKFSADSEHRRT